MSDEDYLKDAGWTLWNYANPKLLPDPGVWADPKSPDQARKLPLTKAVSEQRERDQQGLYA